MKKLTLLLALAIAACGISFAQDAPLYTSLGEVAPTEGWGQTPMPELSDVPVDGYDGYIVIRDFAGVEGYGVKVELGVNDAITSVASIVDGEVSEPTTQGYIAVPSGREDFPTIKMYVGKGYAYGSSDAASESGYFIIYAKFGDETGYYFITWPQTGGGQGGWENPFEAEATFLGQGIGSTGNEEDWGASVFPEIDNIKVDVYDTYVYIHGLGGVEGYDAKVAYDENEAVLSIIGIADGVESEPCQTYLYLETGLAEYPTIQAYTDYSYAGAYDDGSGYVLLSAYIYDNKGKYDWSYYYLTWTKDESDSISSPLTDSDDSPAYNPLGQKWPPATKASQ